MAHVLDEKSLPASKIDVSRAMGGSIPHSVPTRFQSRLLLGFKPLWLLLKWGLSSEINPPLKPAPLRKLKFHGLSRISSIYSKNFKRLSHRAKKYQTNASLFMYSRFDKDFTV